MDLGVLGQIIIEFHEFLCPEEIDGQEKKKSFLKGKIPVFSYHLVRVFMTTALKIAFLNNCLIY